MYCEKIRCSTSMSVCAAPQDSADALGCSGAGY
jgi:hypothetical protein